MALAGAPQNDSGTLDKVSIKAAARNSLKWETDRILVQFFLLPTGVYRFSGPLSRPSLPPALSQAQFAPVMLEAA